MTGQSDDRAAIGRRRKAYRVATGWTQRQVAQAAGVTEKTVANAEAGEMISERTICMIAGALTVNPADYMCPPVYAGSPS